MIDDQGIDLVSCFLNGSPLETDYTAPFHCTFDTDDLGLAASQFYASHQILARAFYIFIENEGQGQDVLVETMH